MANTRTIRRRIRSVQNIAKITRAMEMIATSKMRRAQEQGLAGRPYSNKIREVISDLVAVLPENTNLDPLLQRRQVDRIALVHITPDRGFTGGLGTFLNRTATGFIQAQKGAPVSLICVGRKGLDYMHRSKRDVVAEFTGLGDKPKFNDTLPISRIIIDDYVNHKIDAAYIVYARFVSTMVQKPVVQQILPVQPAPSTEMFTADYIYEPGPHQVLAGLLPRFVEIQVLQAILESIASEQSARMVAMRNATDNAKELTDDLTLLYNKARQETITKELLDINGGMAAWG